MRKTTTQFLPHQVVVPARGRPTMGFGHTFSFQSIQHGPRREHGPMDDAVKEDCVKRASNAVEADLISIMF